MSGYVFGNRFFCSHEVVVPDCPSSSLITGGDLLVEQVILEKLLATLRANGCERPNHVAIGNLFRFHLSELKAYLNNVTVLLDMYRRASDYPATTTRFNISESTGLSLNGPALMMNNPHIISAVTQIGEFRIVKVIFPGGREIPYAAQQSEVDNEVECAKLFTSLIAERKDLALVPCTVETMDKEAFANQLPGESKSETMQKQVSANNKSETVEPQVSANNDGNRFVIHALIMEQYEGTVGKSPQNFYPHILSQTLRLREAVERIHAEGYVHMDIKPANIFIKRGLWYLGDYGSCRSSARKEVIISSTPGMYPFKLDKGSIRAEPRYDFYMLGLTLLLALNIQKYHSLDLITNSASEHKQLIEGSIADLLEGKKPKHPCGGDAKTRFNLVGLIKDLFTRGGCTFDAGSKCTFNACIFNPESECKAPDHSDRGCTPCSRNADGKCGFHLDGKCAPNEEKCTFHIDGKCIFCTFDADGRCAVHPNGGCTPPCKVNPSHKT